ncbi:MAG: hypothetical protein RLN88_02310 [Ekhidna sp.]|uniref:hypothetical protein n=1 Tax=Ekhidna sp. TaxID=2608089 RepID=UPI0032F030BC
MRFYILIVTLFTFSCGSTTQKEQAKEEKPEVVQEKKEKEQVSSDFKVVISRIENIAHVYVDDSLIYKSEYHISTKDGVNEQIDISSYVENGAKKVTVALYNGNEPYENQTDTYWEIMYDLILDGEVVDFVHETRNETKLGRVYEAEYVIEDWRFSE